MKIKVNGHTVMSNEPLLPKRTVSFVCWPTVSNDPTIQHFYEQCRREGTSHSMAEMFALKQCPGIQTDSTYFEGTRTLADQFAGDDRGLKIVLDGARRNGYTPNINDRYEPGLCHPDIGAGDPAAFVPATGGRGHIKKVIERRGWDCHGAVSVKSPKKDEPPVQLGDNIVQSFLAKTEDKKLLKASAKEQRQEAAKALAPNW